MKFVLIVKKVFLAIGILALYEILIKGFIYLACYLLQDNFILALVIIIPATFVMRFLAIKFYDRRKEDSIGIEAIKSNTIPGKETLVAKILRLLLKIGNIAAYLIIALDSTATVIYFRKGSYLWNGIPDKKTWKLFILSNIICSVEIAFLCKKIIESF